jgi:2-methylisocitrate lyase-like PEP mutase family enzyme
MLFVEAPRSREDLGRIVTAHGGKLPLLANMVEGGKTPTLPAAELEAIGFALVIFPGAIVRALGHMASEFYASLAANGSTEPFRNRMLDFDGINELVGTSEMIALGRRYEAPDASDKAVSVRR